MPRSVKWCFTVLDYKDSDLVSLNELPESKINHVKYVIYSKHVSMYNTRELHGFIYFNKEKHQSGVKYLLPANSLIEQARGSVEEHIQDCTKVEYTERGIKPQVNKNQGASRKRKTSEMLHALLTGSTEEHMIDQYGSSYIFQRKKLKALASDMKEDEVLKEMRKEISDMKLNKWQSKALLILDTQDDYQVLFIIDTNGKNGKTTFANYLIAERGAAYFNNQKPDDIKYLYEGQPYVIFDFSATTNIHYDIIEEIKNGIYFSPKKHSCVKHFKDPKVCVFMSFSPDLTKMSKPRYNVMDISTSTYDNDTDEDETEEESPKNAEGLLKIRKKLF